MAESADVYSDFVFLLIPGEERKAGRTREILKRRKERKRVPNPRKSVLIAYECLCLKNYRIDVVVLFFDSLSVTFF